MYSAPKLETTLGHFTDKALANAINEPFKTGFKASAGLTLGAWIIQLTTGLVTLVIVLGLFAAASIYAWDYATEYRKANPVDRPKPTMTKQTKK